MPDLSGPCELLFFTLFYCLLDLSCSECDRLILVFPCILCAACLTVFVNCYTHTNCLVKQFTICLGVVVILLLNVMEVFSVGGGALLD